MKENRDFSLSTLFALEIHVRAVLNLQRFSRGITMLHDWLKKTRATFSSNQMSNQKHSSFVRFPALRVSYTYLLQVLIG